MGSHIYVTICMQSHSLRSWEILVAKNIKILGIKPYESYQKDYKHVQSGQRSRLQSDSSEK